MPITDKDSQYMKILHYLAKSVIHMEAHSKS